MKYNVEGPYYICAVNLILAHMSPVKQKQLITVDSLGKTKTSLTSKTFIKPFIGYTSRKIIESGLYIDKYVSNNTYKLP
jgi:hypothetical protein